MTPAPCESSPGAGQVEHAAGRHRPLLALERVGRRVLRPRARRGDLRPEPRQVGQLPDPERLRDVPLHREAVAVLRRRERERLGADAGQRALERRAAEVAEQRARVAGPHPDASAPHRGDRLGAKPPDAAHGHAEARAAQRRGVHVRERLVLGEVLKADDDPRAGAPARPVAAEPVGVDEVAADRLGQAAVDDLLVERAQLQRREQPGRGVQRPPQRRAVALQQRRAHGRDDVVRRDHALVVAQHQEVGAREQRVGGERHRDLRLPVVERLDPGVGDLQFHQGAGGVEAIDAAEPGHAVRVAHTVAGGGEPHGRRLRLRRGAEHSQQRRSHQRDPQHGRDANPAPPRLATIPGGFTKKRRRGAPLPRPFQGRMLAEAYGSRSSEAAAGVRGSRARA